MISIDLSGRKALVTGGSRGIGAGISRVISKCGANVAFTYRSNEKAAKMLEEELNSSGVLSLGIKANATSAEEMRKAVQICADKLGNLDLLAINVGMNEDASIDSLSYEHWKEGIDLNLNSVYLAIKNAISYLRSAERGDIFLIGSSGVYDGGGGTPYYAAAKAGMIGLMRYMMRELPQDNIRINTIHPCVVDTDLLRSRYNTEEKIEKLKSQVPLGRLSIPEDIGNMVAFISSDLGGFITGQSILIDGGRTFWKKT